MLGEISRRYCVGVVPENTQVRSRVGGPDSLRDAIPGLNIILDERDAIETVTSVGQIYPNRLIRRTILTRNYFWLFVILTVISLTIDFGLSGLWFFVGADIRHLLLNVTNAKVAGAVLYGGYSSWIIMFLNIQLNIIFI